MENILVQHKYRYSLKILRETEIPPRSTIQRSKTKLVVKCTHTTFATSSLSHKIEILHLENLKGNQVKKQTPTHRIPVWKM
jgi:predicted transcriptional regulator